MQFSSDVCRGILSMSSDAQFILTSMLSNLPVLLAGLVAFILILTRWNEIPRAAVWALLGFGLVLILGIFWPFVQGFVQTWVREDATGMNRDRLWAFSVMGIAHSILRALSYIFLLV